MLTLRQFCASLCCLRSSHAKENHASIFVAIGCDVCSLVARLMWVLLISLRVASIALFEPGHRFGWKHDRLISVGRLASVGDLAAADYACRENEECNTCLCHKCVCLGELGASGSDSMKNKAFQGREMESWDRLFFIEIEAVQNAMGKRGYDQGCYADKN